jgi:Zinc finger C-x8-C-x5-C-x3-H type (and similar)
MAGKSPTTIAKEKERELREKEKAEAAKRAKEDAALLAQPVQKIAPGVDPMTVYCVYHKAGYCQKGNKCKFSHDPNVGRKVEKKDVYADSREEKLQGMYILPFPETPLPVDLFGYLADTMDKWDEEKLRKVVSAKGNPRTTTEVGLFVVSLWVCMLNPIGLFGRSSVNTLSKPLKLNGLSPFHLMVNLVLTRDIHFRAVARFGWFWTW